MSAKEKERRDVPQEKEEISRASRRQRVETKKKRRVFLILVLLVVVVLAVGAAFNIPYINIARRGGSWLWDKISGTSQEGESQPGYLFLTQSQTNHDLSGPVSVLLVLYKTDGGDIPQPTVLYLALLTYDAQGMEGEVYLVPESVVAYNASGQSIQLSQALREQGGKDLLRSTVGSLSGLDLDYLVLLECGEAMRVIQNLGLPPVLLGEDLELRNPLNGDTSHLAQGQQIGDADRLLSYLVAADREDPRDARLDRARAYAPQALYQVHGQGTTQLEEGIYFLDSADMLNPGTVSMEENRRYLASMIQAFADLEEEKLYVRTVPKVEVVNGCGLPDLGKKVGGQLVSLGVAVSGTAGNAKVTVDGEEVNDFSHEVSSIICRSQDQRVRAYAVYLGVLMSITDIRYESGPGPEIVLVAGKDLAK